MILGANDVSFDDAVREVEARYMDKSWEVKHVGDNAFIANPKHTTCIVLTHFINGGKMYTLDLSVAEVTDLSQRAQDYSTVLDISASTCV